MNLTADQIRSKFLQFFESKGHKIIPSASLIPENDPSVLFTTAGMHPLVPFLMGEKHPLGTRLTDVQKCIRTGDIDEVGDYCHHTFFEMLGNWSLGDYFKEDAIKWSYEFLTSNEFLGLDKNRLAVSVFMGDESAPFDEESYNIWKSLGINEKRIARLPKNNNWWGPAGITGPCGPDTEMFYWVGDADKIPESFNDDSPLWLEIWNDVFMEYNKNKEGIFEKLSQKNVDTGMGVERILAVVNGFDDNYRTELFWPIIKKIEELSGLSYGDKTDSEYIKEGNECWVTNRKAFRIIADHIKASTFMIGDEKGIVPSNTGQGYVLRRILRRIFRKALDLKLPKEFWVELVKVVFEIYGKTYFGISLKPEDVISIIREEEKKFEKSLNWVDQYRLDLEAAKNGIIKKIASTPIVESNGFASSIYINKNYQTYGVPIDLSVNIAKELGYMIDEKEIDTLSKEHQELSRTSSAGMFKGGLADSGVESTKYHTATHLLLASLRQILGRDITQKGSNITAERMRFDFNWPEKLTVEQLKSVEDLVNQKITEALPVEMQELPKEEAVKVVKNISFDLSKYGDIVKVYKIGDFSIEFCGGPHVSNTSELGHFKIAKEEASSQGIRRIKAVLE